MELRVSSRKFSWIIVLLSAAALGRAVQGQSTTWTGTVSAAWADPQNWTAGVPTATLDATIPSSGVAPSTANAAGAVCRALTVQSGGSLTLPAGFPLDVHGSVSVSGTCTGQAGLRLVGSGTFGGQLPNTEIAADYTVRPGTINGNLLQSAGTVSYDSAATLSVTGNAVFQGQTLTGTGTSATTLDVDGDLTFGTSGLVTVSNHPATIRCAGNWTSNANFQPAGGTVIFDGTGGTQTVVTNHPSGNFQWFNLTIQSGATVAQPPGLPIAILGSLVLGFSTTLSTTATTVNIGGNLTINSGAVLTADSATVFHVGGSISTQSGAGTLSAQTAQLVCLGNFNMVNGTVSLGPNKTHTFGGSVNTGGGTLSSGANSTFLLQGAGTFQSRFGPGPALTSAFPSTEIAGNYDVGLCTINGVLTQTSATLSFQGSGNLLVISDAILQGQTITGSGSASTLDVDGNITFWTSGLVTMAANHPTTIRCAGNWSSNANFQPAGGTVIFDGTGGTQPVVTNHPSGNFQWFNLTIQNIAGIAQAPSLPIALLGSLVLGSGTSLSTTAASVNIAGSLTVGSGAVFTADSATVFHVGGFISLQNSAGTLSAQAAQLVCLGNFDMVNGVVSLGPNQTHTFGGSVLTGGGTLSSGTNSTFLLQGSGTLQTRFGPNPTLTSAFPATEIAGSYDVGLCTINGVLRQTSGTLTFQSSGNLLVSSDAIFQGQTITGSGSASTLDVNGSITFGTSGLVTIASNHPTTIRCAGDWTSNANFQPVAGTIVFDGSGPQTVTAVNLTLPMTVVSNASNVTFNLQSLTVLSDLRVEATFNTPPTSLTVQRDLIVTSTGNVQVGGGTYVINRTLSVATGGSTSGAGTLILEGTGAITGGGSIGNVKVDTTGTVTAGTSTISGEFELAGGTLDVPGVFTAQGDATFSGGTLTGGGTLQLESTASWSGTSAGVSLPVIVAKGDWIADGTFQPGSGSRVIFDPNSGPSTISSTNTNGLIVFNEMQIQGGMLRTGNSPVIQANKITVLSGGVFEVLAMQTVVPLIEVDGELRLIAGSQWLVSDGAVVDIRSTGLLALLGVCATSSERRGIPSLE